MVTTASIASGFAPLLVIADAEDVFRIFMTVVFMFVAFMGWVGQFMKNRQQGAQRKRPPQPQKNERVQNEIERFLQEVTGQQPAKADKPAPRAQAPTPPQRRPRKEVRSSDQRSSQASRGSERPQTAEPKRRVAKRAASDRSQQAVSTTRQSTASHPQNSSASSRRPEQLVVPPRPTQTASARSRDVITSLGTGVAEDLRDPARVRRAIIMNMILGPPKAAGNLAQPNGANRRSLS